MRFKNLTLDRGQRKDTLAFAETGSKKSHFIRQPVRAELKIVCLLYGENNQLTKAIGLASNADLVT